MKVTVSKCLKQQFFNIKYVFTIVLIRQYNITLALRYHILWVGNQEKVGNQNILNVCYDISNEALVQFSF